MNVLDHCIVMRILTFYLFSLMVQLLQQGVETDIWLAVAEIDGQQNPGIGTGATGSNLLMDALLSSVYVSTPSISLSTLDISVFFLESCQLLLVQLSLFLHP